MTDQIASPMSTDARVKEAKLVKARYGADRRFQIYGIFSILIAMLALVTLLVSIVGNGYSAFYRHVLNIEINLEEKGISAEQMKDANARALLRDSIRGLFPEAKSRRQKKELSALVSFSAQLALQDKLNEGVMDNPGRLLVRAPLGDEPELFLKGQATETKELQTSGSLTLSFADTSNSMKPVSLTAEGDLLREVKSSARAYLIDTKSSLERRVVRLKNVMDSQPDDVRAQLQVQLTPLEAKLEKANANLDNIDEQILLDSGLPTFLVKAGPLIIKLTNATSSGADGVVLVGGSEAFSATQRIDEWTLTELVTPEDSRKISDNMIARVMALEAKGLIEQEFNLAFFQTADSRDPEVAGIWGALTGSFLTMIITLLLSFPVAVAAAVYLEEFAPKNRVTDIIEVNINNLAAVPSIVFGLLGLAVFLNTFGLPRSAPLVGGMVLALMTLPTIIIAARAALKAVPPSIREGAVGVGASKMQAVFDHVLPLAMPGMLTGTIIGMAQALGETAPLLLIGMNAFIADVPNGFTSPAAVLPVQIFIWADAPERGFVEKTSAAIMVLLGFLVFMNGLAIYLRKKFERRW